MNRKHVLCTVLLKCDVAQVSAITSPYSLFPCSHMSVDVSAHFIVEHLLAFLSSTPYQSITADLRNCLYKKLYNNPCMQAYMQAILMLPLL